METSDYSVVSKGSSQLLLPAAAAAVVACVARHTQMVALQMSDFRLGIWNRLAALLGYANKTKNKTIKKKLLQILPMLQKSNAECGSKRIKKDIARTVLLG